MKKKSSKAECGLGVTQHCACVRGSWQEVQFCPTSFSSAPITADNLSSKCLCQPRASARLATWRPFQKHHVSELGEIVWHWWEKTFDWSSSLSMWESLVYFVSDLYWCTKSQTLLPRGCVLARQNLNYRSSGKFMYFPGGHL